jgi:hypothetical protein
MKTRNTDDIRRILKQTWPALEQIWLFDHEMVCISAPEIEAIVKEVWQKMKQLGEKLDCDEQALFLHAAVKKYWAVNYKGDGALAFGEAAGTKFNGWPDIHNQNMAVCEDGSILMIEPQTKETWPAHKTDDQPFWMRF